MGEIGLSPFSSIAALFSFLSFLIALYNGCGICGYRLKCVCVCVCVCKKTIYFLSNTKQRLLNSGRASNCCVLLKRCLIVN